MENVLIEAMEDINIQINQLDKELDYLFISGYIRGRKKAVKSMPDTFINTEVL